KEPPSKESVYQVSQKFEHRLRDLINQKNSSLWGWKDPRTVLTIDLYLHYLNNPHFIICSRNAESIAQSMVRRNQMDSSEAKKIISEYEERIKDFVVRNPYLPTLNISYEDAVEYPEYMIETLISFLNITVSEDMRRKALTLVLPKEEVRRLSLKVKRKQSVNFLIKKTCRRAIGTLKKLRGIFSSG
ncbi:MAG: sulfotransferase, partial [Candidatus Hodarchaeota archaeon]